MNRKLSLSVLLLAVSGCMVGPNYKRPNVPTPKKYREAPTTQVATTQASQTLPPTNLAEWWKTFNDPMLDRLIQDAVKHNLTLEVARQTVRQARAQLGFTGATFWPEIDADGSATRTRTSQANVKGPSGPSESALFRAGFDTTWELDVFGGIRRQIESAQYSYQQQQWNLASTLTSLLAELATDYTDLRGTQLQIKIAEENVKAFQETLDLTRAKFNAGIVSDLDVARAEAQVQSTAATIPSFQARARTDIHAISVLTGRDPGALVDQLDPPAVLPFSVPPIPVGLPSELLRRRPDIRAAERSLAAATANIGVAVAEYFPQFSLTGSLGLSASSQVKKMFNSSALFYNIGPSVSWPVFDEGRIKWNVEIQNALQGQALATYKQTILTALQEVEDALIQFDREKVRNSELKQAVASEQRAVNLAEQLYNKGLSSFLDLLQAQRDLFSVQTQLVQSDLSLSQDLVAVYKALGGGWENMNTVNTKNMNTANTKEVGKN